MVPMRVPILEVAPPHEPENARVGNERLRQNRFMGPRRVQILEVEAFHEHPIADCRLPIANCLEGRGSWSQCAFDKPWRLSINHRCFPRRFRATADWRETKSAVALNLWGKPCVHGPNAGPDFGGCPSP